MKTVNLHIFGFKVFIHFFASINGLYIAANILVILRLSHVSIDTETDNWVPL